MKKTTIGIVAVLLLGIVATGAFAFGGFDKGRSHDNNRFGMNSTSAVQTALEAGDYQAYRNALEEEHTARMAELTEERFNEIFEQHKEMEEKRAAVDAAIEAKDYRAWVAAIAGSPQEEQLTAVINADNFERYAKLCTARQNQDFETAKEIADELGLEDEGRIRHGPRGAMGQGFGRNQAGHMEVEE